MQSPQTHYLNHQATPNETSGAVKIALVTLFALLWAIWIQPHTIALRQIVLTLGSLLGLYVMSQNLHLFKTRRAIPIYLIGLLFAWITFHLFFLSHQYELQLAEYLTIWKRIAWGVPFAIGLGIALSQLPSQNAKNQDGSMAKYEGVWWIFYAGIVAPTVIYLIRTVLMLLAGKFSWQLPNFAMHWPSTSTWHITKMSTVFFCLPALALACSQCIRVVNQKTQNAFVLMILYVGTIAAVLTVFYLENTKNGFVYSAILIMAMLVQIIVIRKSQWSWRDSAIILLAVTGMTILGVRHIQQNDSWKTLASDLRVAQQLEKIDAWKYYGTKGYPINDLGKTVSITNYERAAWGQVAVGMIGELPLGYGLVYKSFGYYGKDKWPDSILFQAHSAWLDLILGIGIPGVFLLVLAAVLALKNAQQATSQFWSVIALWILSSIVLLMATTEVSQQIYIDALVFLILGVAGLGLHQRPRSRISGAAVY
ncbi:hypothetical protein C2747_01605 [Polynucleobacter corsicus]|nr:hypothetical protein C2747_01605 [Polynucleobacter corsicus]